MTCNDGSINELADRALKSVKAVDDCYDLILDYCTLLARAMLDNNDFEYLVMPELICEIIFCNNGEKESDVEWCDWFENEIKNDLLYRDYKIKK